MEFPTDEQLVEALAEIQGLLNQLQALINRQSGDGTVELSPPRVPMFTPSASGSPLEIWIGEWEEGIDWEGNVVG